MMRRGFQATFGAMFVFMVALATIGSAFGAQELRWRKDKKVDASVPGWPLKKVLGRLAAVSGWKVYVEPDLDEPISVEFRNASQSEALKLLFGKFNYALIPDSKSASKLYVYRTSLGDATPLVKPEVSGKPTNWLANEIVLVLPRDSKEDVDKLAASLGGKVVAKSDNLNAYRLQFSDAETAEAARQKLTKREDLDVQDNYAYQRPPVSASASQNPAALFPIDPKPVTPGSQVTVALVDTALQPLEGKMKDFVLPAIHVSDTPTSLPADPTHATSMAQTILNSMALSRENASSDGNLGNVRLLPIDIYGSSPSTTTFEVAQGLYKAIQSGAQVVNLSLGGAGDSPMVEYLLEMARKKQMMVFASAGNTPTADLTWPAASPNAIAVTATDWTGNIAPYANFGPFVDIKAPGSSRIYYNGQTYVSTGTSTATAFVSGQAAALAARGLTPAQTTEAILKTFNVDSPAVQRGPRR